VGDDCRSSGAREKLRLVGRYGEGQVLFPGVSSGSAVHHICGSDAKRSGAIRRGDCSGSKGGGLDASGVEYKDAVGHGGIVSGRSPIRGTGKPLSPAIKSWVEIGGRFSRILNSTI
jgi:hypothetical protein